MRWEEKGHDSRTLIHDVMAYASEHVGRPSFLHYFTHGMVASHFVLRLSGLLGCDTPLTIFLPSCQILKVTEASW